VEERSVSDSRSELDALPAAALPLVDRLPWAETSRLARLRGVLPKPGVAVHYGLLLVLLALSFFIVLVMVALSLRPTVLIYVDFWALPWPPSLVNYRAAVLDLVPSLLRTLYVCALSIAGVLVISCGAAYAFARFRFPGRDLLFYLVLAVLMVPSVILLTPHFIIASDYGLRGSLWGLIVFYIAGGLPFAIFLITTFFRSQPAEIFEAARIDGASELQALRQIAIPLAWPILVTVAIFNFLGIYGDYIWPSLMVPPHLETLILALERYNPQLGEFGTRPEIGMQAAGYVFATLPQLVVFALGMKYFIQGVTSGAVKA
jgi:ABC-type glycerol-3-phosphate transport system permease component